jgi:hypothetical protein
MRRVSVFMIPPQIPQIVWFRTGQPQMTQMSQMVRTDGQRKDHPQISQIPQIVWVRTGEPQMTQMAQMWYRSGHPQISQIPQMVRVRTLGDLVSWW